MGGTLRPATGRCSITACFVIAPGDPQSRSPCSLVDSGARNADAMTPRARSYAHLNLRCSTLHVHKTHGTVPPRSNVNFAALQCRTISLGVNPHKRNEYPTTTHMQRRWTKLHTLSTVVALLHPQPATAHRAHKLSRRPPSGSYVQLCVCKRIHALQTQTQRRRVCSCDRSPCAL